jgi:hypothetical protein
MAESDSSDSDDERHENTAALTVSRGHVSTASHGGGRSTSGGQNVERRVAAIEGVTSDVKKYLEGGVRRPVSWAGSWQRFVESNLPAEWKPWGTVAANEAGYLELRDAWLTWMACTSKVLQTVDNRHMNRHEDYLYSGPSIHFVDLQDTPAISRRLQVLSHFVECINNFGEFPFDCVIPTPETELLFGQGKGCKTVRGMRMKNTANRATREVPLTSSRAGNEEKWLKSFKRGKLLSHEEHLCDPVQSGACVLRCTL